MIPIRNDLSMTANAESRPAGRDGGPARRLQSDSSARLSHADYEKWLLPPVPRDGIERVVHALSLAAGVLAVTGVSAALWFTI